MSPNLADFTFLQGVKIVDLTQFDAGPSWSVLRRQCHQAAHNLRPGQGIR
jgi:hypothetical protein